MYKKLLSTIFTFSTIIAIVSIILTTVIVYYFFTGEMKNELKNQMGLLKPGVESQGEAYLKEVTVPERITLISPNGDVIYDNFRATPLENHLNRTEVQDALNSGEGSSTRYSETLNETTYYYAIKLKNGDILRISMDQASIFQVITGFIQIYMFIILGAIIVSYFISRKLVTSIVDSIENIDPEHPMEKLSYPELDPLLIKINNQNQQIEEQLKKVNRQRADFETITANMNEGIIVTNSEGKVRSINSAAKNLLGIDNIALGDQIFISIRDNKLRDLIENALAGVKDTLVLKQGEKILSIIASPITIMNEQTGIVTIVIDITERAQMEQLRSEYIANVSHELKTPLTSISGFAEIINNGLVKPEDVKHFAGRIYDEAQHLIHIVNDVLTIGYLDENNNKILKVSVNLKTISEEIINRLENKANSKQVKVKLITKGDPIVVGNSDILTELLFNLVDNAIKYNKENGKVIVFINGKLSDSVIIKVIDSGIGIPNDEKDRIFERFYRLEKSRTNKNEGTGLGLSIVKHAALVHHATVDITSKPSQGSVFTLEIPRIN